MTKDNRSKIIEKMIKENYVTLLGFDVADGNMILNEFFIKCHDFYKIGKR